MLVVERAASVRSAMGVKRAREANEHSELLTEWRVLESGVLAVQTPLKVSSVKTGECRAIWFDPQKRRLVCPHGWGQYHLSCWNGPRADAFPKPVWTTCDCGSATGVCARKRLKTEAAAAATPPSYYETLVAMHGTTELRGGLCGARVPGVQGADGGAFYMVRGDAPSVLRCRHGHTTNTLSAQARERRRWAAGLVLTALFGRRVAVRALRGGAAPPAAATTTHGTARALVRLLVAWHATREARRARRGAVVVACGCAPVYVKACVRVKAGDGR